MNAAVNFWEPSFLPAVGVPDISWVILASNCQVHWIHGLVSVFGWRKLKTDI